MKKLILFLALSLISNLCPAQEIKKEEGKYFIPPVTVNYIIEQEYAPKSESYPGFLKNRGDFKVFKELSGNGKGIKVGIVDTGIDTVHTRGGGELAMYDPNKPNQQYAVKAAKDFTNSRSGWGDRAGHGTHVAGHIGARVNGNGIEGIASECDLYIAKGLGDRGFGTDNQIASAILWLIDQKVDIINLSIGGGYSDRIEKACQLAYENNILVFAALGNDGTNSDGHPGNSKYTFGISAVDYALNIARFSSRSDMAVYSGYGVNVFSTINGGRYAEYSGTSMATPDQCGIAALILGYSKKIGKPIEGMQDYNEFVKSDIKDLGSIGWDREYGLGFILADKVIIPIQQPDPEDPFDPEDPPDPVDPDEPVNPAPNNPYEDYKVIFDGIWKGTKYLILEEIK